MKKQLCIVFFVFTFRLIAQNNFKAIVKDSVTNETLFGVAISVENTTLSGTSDINGKIIIKDIPSGVHLLMFYSVGYSKLIKSINFPVKDSIVIILLSPLHSDLEEVIVSTTRSNSRIDDLPTKVEVLGQEDMNEESTIVPGNVSSILGDLSIITIQRTNPINGNESIRMQGLDSKYTQLMRDGFPLYGGFSGSLGVLAIPPLDLKQVEIIKGSASTLYGGGAIGGLINFISKVPVDSTQATIILNATTLGEGNVNAFVSGKRKRIGATLFAGANVKKATDINDDGFAEIPNDQNYLLHPRLFFDINKTSQLIVGLTSNYDARKSGDITAINSGVDSVHTFLQKEEVWRNTIDLTFTKQFSENNILTIKSAGSAFQRDLNNSGFIFNGVQYSSYSEVNDYFKIKKHRVVAGVNFTSESFALNKSNAANFHNYNYSTTGLFIQDDWQVLKKLSVQLGLRYDNHNVFGDFILPRLSLFYRPTNKLSIRLAGGSGYKIPSLFDVTEPYYNISNNFSSNVLPEKSYGSNADINFHTVLFDKLSFAIDQAFYYTIITNPVILGYNTNGNYTTINGKYDVKSYGSDTYIRLKYEEVELYLGYNHTEAAQYYSNATYNMPFNPKDKFSATLAYEIENKWRAGIENSYTANQYIYFNTKVHNIWFMALMVERKLKFGSIVLNCENLLDNRQSNYETLVDGNTQSPMFKPIWGAVEGRVINLSLKIKL